MVGKVNPQINSAAKLCFNSRPGRRRPAFIPTVIALCVAWVLDIAFAISMAAGMSHSTAMFDEFALALAMSVAFLAYLIYFTRQYIIELSNHYTFEVNDNQVRLKVDAADIRQRHVAQMAIPDIRFVEYFTPRDNAALVFHGKTGRTFEVPLWSMVDDAFEILAFLQARGIPVVRI